MATWDEDSAQLQSNLISVLEDAALHALSRRVPSAEQMRSWHTRMFLGIRIPRPEWAGCYRGSPCAPTVDVFVPQRDGRRCYGARASDVETAVEAFIAGLERAVATLDARIPTNGVPVDRETLEGVLALCAAAHAHWIRIHPFVNGNGRTARLWANWVAVRYGLPRFVRLRPRPEGDAYEAAGREALCSGQVPATLRLFRAMYLGAVSG